MFELNSLQILGRHTTTVILAVLSALLIFAKVPALSLQARGGEQYSKRNSLDLDTLLQKTADYCRKLENVAFDFVCLENIEERIDPALDAPWALDKYRTRDPRYWDAPWRRKTFHIYDYQCLRSGGEIRETRTLLEENGKKRKEPNAQLKTSVVVYKNVLFSPLNVFGERFQPTYAYKIIGQGKIKGRPVVIVDATPKAGAPETKNLYGKAWIDAETVDILKIEWSENRIGHYDIFQQRGKKYRQQPRITLRSEFLAEKNGIRFPSRLFVEEAYINAWGHVFVRSETTVVYRDFRFFTVEVEIR